MNLRVWTFFVDRATIYSFVVEIIRKERYPPHANEMALAHIVVDRTFQGGSADH